MATSISIQSNGNRASEQISFRALVLICSFFCDTPQDAVLRFGPVCRRWHEVMVTQCREMWGAFYLQIFGDKLTAKQKYHQLHLGRDSYFSLLQLLNFGQFPLLVSREDVEKSNLAQLPPHVMDSIQSEQEWRQKTRNRVDRFMRLMKLSRQRAIASRKSIQSFTSCFGSAKFDEKTKLRLKNSFRPPSWIDLVFEVECDCYLPDFDSTSSFSSLTNSSSSFSLVSFLNCLFRSSTTIPRFSFLMYRCSKYFENLPLLVTSNHKTILDEACENETSSDECFQLPECNHKSNQVYTISKSKELTVALQDGSNCCVSLSSPVASMLVEGQSFVSNQVFVAVVVGNSNVDEHNKFRDRGAEILMSAFQNFHLLHHQQKSCHIAAESDTIFITKNHLQFRTRRTWPEIWHFILVENDTCSKKTEIISKGETKATGNGKKRGSSLFPTSCPTLTRANVDKSSFIEWSYVVVCPGAGTIHTNYVDIHTGDEVSSGMIRGLKANNRITYLEKCPYIFENFVDGVSYSDDDEYDDDEEVREDNFEKARNYYSSNVVDYWRAKDPIFVTAAPRDDEDFDDGDDDGDDNRAPRNAQPWLGLTSITPHQLLGQIVGLVFDAIVDSGIQVLKRGRVRERMWNQTFFRYSDSEDEHDDEQEDD